MEDKRSFVYYHDWCVQLLQLPESLRLRIDDSIKRYVLFGEEPTDKEVLYSMFALMRSQIDRDRQRWNETSKKRRDAANIRWNASDANASNCIQKHNLHYDNVNGNDHGNDKVIKKESKPKKSNLSLTLPQRRMEFKKSLEPFLEEYGKDMLNDFFSYWSECDRRGQMAFEKQRTFEPSKRLQRWARNERSRK